MSRRAALLALAVVAVAAVSLGIAAVGLASTRPPASTTIEIRVRYSHFIPDAVAVPVGVPVTFRLINEDPIDHEWIVGDEALHARHRTSTEPVHPAIPTEIVLPAETTMTTTITFAAQGKLAYICHLPGHEAYGMTGWVTIGS
jgi:uncharacterized cupredoxin-like copper-binding protein